MIINKDSELFKKIETELKETESYMFKEIIVAKSQSYINEWIIKEIEQIDFNKYKITMIFNNNEKIYVISKCCCCSKFREMQNPIVESVCYGCFAAYY